MTLVPFDGTLVPYHLLGGQLYACFLYLCNKCS